jgi:hypothetical protein
MMKRPGLVCLTYRRLVGSVERARKSSICDQVLVDVEF